MPASDELVTQFTEDARATQDRLCDRKACKKPKIKKGDPLYYVATYNALSPGKFVCGPCYIHYSEKPSSSVRMPSASGAAQHGQGSISGQLSAPDPQRIRRAISAARSQSMLNPPPVVAMSPSYRSLMPPPPVPPSRLPALQHQHGPSVYVPNAWGAPGYGPQHSQYDHHGDRWAGYAQLAALPETYALEISAVYESGMRKRNMRGNVFGSICEGVKDVDAYSSAQDLVKIALKILLPRIVSFCPGFPWRDDEFVVRDKEWVNLSKVDGNEPYFYDECLRECTRKNSQTKVFKTGKQFALFVVVPERQWEDLEEFKEKELASGPATSQNAGFVQRTPRRSGAFLPPPSMPSTTPVSSDVGPNLSISMPIAFVNNHSVAARSTSSVRIIPAANADTSLSVNENLGTASKRRHNRTDSSTSNSARSPPPKKCGSPAVSAPNCDQLKLALQSDGGADLDVKNVLRVKVEPLDLYPTPVCKLEAQHC